MGTKLFYLLGLARGHDLLEVNETTPTKASAGDQGEPTRSPPG